jgi:hypothetical protein
LNEVLPPVPRNALLAVLNSERKLGSLASPVNKISRTDCRISGGKSSRPVSRPWRSTVTFRPPSFSARSVSEDDEGVRNVFLHFGLGGMEVDFGINSFVRLCAIFFSLRRAVANGKLKATAIGNQPRVIGVELLK